MDLLYQQAVTVDHCKLAVVKHGLVEEFMQLFEVYRHSEGSFRQKKLRAGAGFPLLPSRLGDSVVALGLSAGLSSMRRIKLLLQLATALTLVLVVTWVAIWQPLPAPLPAPLAAPLAAPEKGAPPTVFDAEDAYNGSMKTILFWNRFFDIKHFGQRVGHKMFDDYECEERRCFVADYQDGETLPLPVEDFDMVVFHGLDMDSRNIPAARRQHQRYVFLLHESPATNPLHLRPWDGFFNLTATYRRDSDIFMPYGWLVPLGAPRSALPQRNPKWLQPPTVTPETPRLPRLLATWLVSNCVNTPSNREQLVLALAQYVPVDVLGKCGRACVDVECDREVLAMRYAFYLALENSICRDYVTEKLYSTLGTDMVPVVLGGADYSLATPPGSVVNAADFATPRLLADHLLKLDADPEAYERHFWWKRHYEVRQGTDHVMCSMCAMLHNVSLLPRVVADLHAWWNDGTCVTTKARLTTWLKRVRTAPAQVAEHAFVTLARQDVRWVACFGVSAAVAGYLLVVMAVKSRFHKNQAKLG